MTKFNDWFTTKLTVRGMPNMSDWYKIGEEKYDIAINVSDEHNWNMINTATSLGLNYFWLPMHEYSKMYNIGLNSIYAALLIMYEAEQQNKRVVLFCHAGSNRSPMIEAAYHFMRIGKHQMIESKPIDPKILAMFTDTLKKSFDAELENIEKFNDAVKDLSLPASTKVTIVYPDVTPFDPADYEYGNNRLLENIRQGFLPARPKMEKFLKECNKDFYKYINQTEEHSTPSLDEILLKSQIN